MAKINYDKFIKYLVEHSASDEFKNALYAQGLYFDNNELKSIEYRPKFKIGDRITDGRWTYTVKDMDLFNNLYSLENDNGYKTNMVFSYIDKEYKLANIGTFPELTESEDERIRKKLIKLVKMSNEVGGFALHKWEADEMIAWIKKQGEQKPTWSEDDEKMLVDAYVMLDWYKGNNWWTARRIKDWLNSLKERIGG